MFAGLLRTVLRRSRADWPVVLASWVLLTFALALPAAGLLYSDAVTLAGLRREMSDARGSTARSSTARSRRMCDTLPAHE